MQESYTQIVKQGTPVVVRSYTSGVVVGKLVSGSSGVVSVNQWRHLRKWRDVGGEGSVYDLIKSDKVPTERGPFMSDTTILQQADVVVISDEDYSRLAK